MSKRKLPRETQAAQIARWGKLKWHVKPSEIKTLSEASFADDWDSEKKRRNASEVTFGYPLYRETLKGKFDIGREVSRLRKLIGKKAAIYVGGVAFGNVKKYRLVGVDVSNIEQVLGVIVHCEVHLRFSEVKKSSAKARDKKRVKRKTTRKPGKKG